jgi:hypothetical protein
MDRYEQFRRAAIDKGIPSDEVDKFAGQLRFAIWAHACGPDEEVVGQGGGIPLLPVGMEWPSREGWTPLPFIASFDCAALPRVEGLPLPTDGSLLFFLHHEDDHVEGGEELARVLYVPAGTDTAAAALPYDPDSEFYLEGIPFLIPEYRLSAQVEVVLPQWIDERDEWPIDVESEAVQQLFAELKHIDELCDVVDDLWPTQDGDSIFRIGGHYRAIGGDEGPWYRMASANFRNRPGVEPRLPRPEEERLIRAEEYRLTQDWVTLAQFYTESEVYYGCFLISADDLAAKRFDKMRSFTRFTE